ncbi:hypothetical protein LTR65_004370 [Meristemomyces frigidus]
MLKTHKPRGHFWTCASVFQQSKEIRNLKFEDCTPPPAETFGSDSDDELRPSERAGKRRRIEKLADGFLGGAPLVISTARPHAASLKTMVEWNERSRLSSKWSLSVPESVQGDSELWVDVEDEWQALPKHQFGQKAKSKAKPARMNSDPHHASATAETFTEKLVAAAQPAASGSVTNGSYHTAPEDTELESPAAEGLSQTDPQADSQTRLLRQQGIHAAPRKSWVSTNEPALTAPGEPTLTTSTANVPKSSAASSIRQSLQESAQHAGKARKGKRAKTTGNNTPHTAAPPTRRRSAPTESQNAAEQMTSLPVDQQRRMSAFRVSVERQAYPEAQPAQEGDTPFMFRKKRASKPDDGDPGTHAITDQQKKGRRRVTFSSSEDAQVASKANNAQHVAAEPPMLDMSLHHDSSFGMRLNMALVDEHLNALLPTEPGSSRRSSGVKRALRQELRDSGADISRIAGEPMSSQACMQGDKASSAQVRDAVGQARRDSLSGSGCAADDQQAAQAQWPGTQAALYQAHRDLFASPEKPAAASDLTTDENPDTPKVTAAVPADSAARQPLRELSQEQMPGTQAMMAGWSPWSNIRKPKALTTRPVGESPTVRRTSTTRRSRSSRLSNTASDPVTTSDGADRRRSSLRFSTTTGNSPLASSRLQYQVSKPTSSQDVDKNASFGTPSTPRSILKKGATQDELPRSDGPLAWDPTTVASFEAIQMSDPTGFSMGAPRQSSYEAGQGHLLLEDSDIDRTINELTADVLSTIDMYGVMSQ